LSGDCPAAPPTRAFLSGTDQSPLRISFFAPLSALELTDSFAVATNPFSLSVGARTRELKESKNQQCNKRIHL